MAVEKGYALTEADRRCLALLQGFLPKRVFDMHTHAYDQSFMPVMAGPGSIFVPPEGRGGYDTYMRYQGRLCESVEELWVNSLMIPDAAMAEDEGLRRAAAQYMADRLALHKNMVAALPALPRDSAEDLAQLILHERIRGFKVYHFHARTRPTFLADLDEFIPEGAWEICHARGMFLTLHLVKAHSLNDETNLRYIRTMARRYPNAQLILAHGGRAFAAWTAVESIWKLRDYPNVWVDISALCEPQAIVAAVRALGVKRVLWGSDYPVSMSREKCVSVGDSFLWLGENTVDPARSKTDCELVLCGIEQLMAFQQAARMLCLSKSDLEDIFFGNAMRLLGLRDAKRDGPLAEAYGGEAVDAAGGRLYDFASERLRVRPLGYAHRAVTGAAMRAVQSGGVCRESDGLTEELLRAHSWAKSAVLTRGGKEALLAAVETARSLTGRRRILYCGPVDACPPDAWDCAAYGDESAFRALDEGCALVIARMGNEKSGEYWTRLRGLSKEQGTLFAADETLAGFRLRKGGAHVALGIEPDMAIFGESLGNGYAIGALLGAGVLAQGRYSEPDAVAVSAAESTLRVFDEAGVPRRLAELGGMLRRTLAELGTALGCELIADGGGYDWRVTIALPEPLWPAFTGAMRKNGFIVGKDLYVSLAHSEHSVGMLCAAAGEALRTLMGGGEPRE